MLMFYKMRSWKNDELQRVSQFNILGVEELAQFSSLQKTVPFFLWPAMVSLEQLVSSFLVQRIRWLTIVHDAQ